MRKGYIKAQPERTKDMRIITSVIGLLALDLLLQVLPEFGADFGIVDLVPALTYSGPRDEELQ